MANLRLVDTKNTIIFHLKEGDCMPEALEFVESRLNEAEVPLKIVMKMNIVVDEIFSNIIQYSGADEALIECSARNGMITLIFKDNGMPYNPLEAEEPDINLSAEERQIGGLGIFIVKKTMDDVSYVYQDERNILTLSKQYE